MASDHNWVTVTPLPHESSTICNHEAEADLFYFFFWILYTL